MGTQVPCQCNTQTRSVVEIQLEITKIDPLLCNLELPLEAIYHPLGFSVEIATNSPEVLEGAEESWGHFRKVFPEPPVQIRIGVLEGGRAECPPAPVVRAQRNLLTQIADRENFAACDLREGFAFAWLTPAVVNNRAYLRYHFLEGTAWHLLVPLYLTPLHGACVQKAGRGVLLCGESGAGKSSLAFACARGGWTFLTDDSSCLIRRRPGRVVTGNPYQMRFDESAMELFPELKDQRITPRATGGRAIELATASMPEIATTSECSVDYIVFLNRGEPQPPGLAPFPKNIALQWFERVLCYGEKAAVAAQKTSLRNLLTAKIFEMRYSDLDMAVKLLEGLVHEGGEPADESVRVEIQRNA
jgi:hypothetical protein